MKSGKGTDERQRIIEQFWHNYQSVLEKFNVHKGARRWYRKHVQMYMDAHKGLPLSQHSPLVVDKYLNAKGRMVHLEAWQFRQVVDALRLLFCELLRSPWAADYDWHRWRIFAQDLAPDHPTLMREFWGNNTQLSVMALEIST